VKILIVNRFFGGAQIPTGRMAEDVARVLVAEGHEVTALASSGAYEGAAQARDDKTSGLLDDRTKGQHDEKRQGTQRAETVPIPNWMPRALAWLWFTWQARKRIPLMEWDVCVLMTDPPLLPLLARRAARLKDQKTKRPRDEEPKNRTGGQMAVDSPEAITEAPAHRATRRVAVWLMDLYPEALAASGRLSEKSPVYRWYFNKRQQALGASDLLLFLGETQKQRLETKRPKDQESQTAVAVVPPWDDRGNIALATEESLRNLALYAGNLGEAHCFEEILAAAPHLPGDWKVRFAVRGAKAGALRTKAAEFSHSRATRDSVRRSRGQINAVPCKGVATDKRGLTRMNADLFSAGDTGAKSSLQTEGKHQGAEVEVTGYASEEETPGLLASARVHLITMSPGWEGIVVPSKLYGCIRTGRPVLFIGPENADTAREIRANDWGGVLPPGASGELVAAAILELAARPTHATESENGAKKVAGELIQLAEGNR
jgi:hypothetical protein